MVAYSGGAAALAIMSHKNLTIQNGAIMNSTALKLLNALGKETDNLRRHL